MIKYISIITILLSIIYSSTAISQTSPQRLVVVPAGGSGTIYTGSAGLVAAVTAANAMAGPAAVVIYAGTYTIDATNFLPPITKTTGLTIEGEGRGVQINVACDPMVSGRIFTLRGAYIDIRNFTIGYLNACTTYTDAPFGIESGNDINATNIVLNSPPGLTVLGTSTTTPARVNFRDIYGPNWQAGRGVSAIKILTAVQTTFDNVQFVGNVACATTNQTINISPTLVTDTIIMRHVDIYSSGGCARSLTIDFSNANIANIWIDDCVLDQSTMHGVEILSSGTNATFLSNVRMRNCTVNAQSGGNAVFISVTNPNALLNALEFDHNSFVARGQPVIVLDSASTGTIRSMGFYGNDISMATTGWSGPGVVVQLGMDNFTFIGNRNTPADIGSAVSHSGSVYFKTTKSVANGIIQGNFSSFATTTLDTSGGTIMPSAVSGNIP